MAFQQRVRNSDWTVVLVGVQRQPEMANRSPKRAIALSVRDVLVENKVNLSDWGIYNGRFHRRRRHGG